MPYSSPYFKGFVGSLIIHGVLLFCLIVGFNQRTVLTSHNTSDTLIQAVMVESPSNALLAPPSDTQAQQALQAEQQRQIAQQKIEDASKAAQLKKDMLVAKKIAAEQKAPETVESPPLEKPDLAAIAVQEEHLAEQARLKAVRVAKEKEQKKQAHLKEQKAQKAAAALKAQDEARKTKIAEEHKRMAAEKSRLAAHHAQVNTAVSSVVSQWSRKIEDNRRLMPEFQSLAQDLSCKISLQILPDGSARAQLVQSSGNTRYDDLALKAIYKAEPFTLPEDPEVRDKVKAIEFNFLNGE